MTIWVRCRAAELEFVIKYCSKRAYYEYFFVSLQKYRNGYFYNQ